MCKIRYYKMLQKANRTTCITACILWGRYHLHTGDYILGGKQTLIGLVVAHRFRQVHAFHFIRNKTMSVQIEQSPAMGGYKMIIWAACDEMSVIRHMENFGILYLLRKSGEIQLQKFVIRSEGCWEEVTGLFLYL